jgi:hypothetical protein
MVKIVDQKMGLLEKCLLHWGWGGLNGLQCFFAVSNLHRGRVALALAALFLI